MTHSLGGERSQTAAGLMLPLANLVSASPECRTTKEFVPERKTEKTA
jgi:hypothetical protein